MKLKLINFKCYTEKTFEFDDNSFILISAPSGAGKSTILLAIQYVLYGIGSNVKYYGKTNCSVEFEYDGIPASYQILPSNEIKYWYYDISCGFTDLYTF